MASINDEKLQLILKYDKSNDAINFRQWFLKQFHQGSALSEQHCKLDEFAVYFLNALRQHTEVHLKSTNGNETPKCQTPVRTIRSCAVKEDSMISRRLALEASHGEVLCSTPLAANDSFKNASRCSDYELQSSFSTSRLNSSVDRLGYSQRSSSTSTPIRRNVSNNSKRLSTTPTSSVCLGDFLVLNSSSSHGNRAGKKKTPNHQNAKDTSAGAIEKPKKRLQPTTISKKVDTTPLSSSSVFAGESSFSNENNILKIGRTELEDKEQCSILAARKTLKLNASEITKELVKSDANNVNSISTSALFQTEELSNELSAALNTNDDKIELDLQQFEDNTILNNLANIYCCLIDLNMCTNLLNELSFLLNLLNAISSSAIKSTNPADSMKSENPFECLEAIEPAVFFAINCLTQEKQKLALLDIRSLKVVLSNERFTYLPQCIQQFLADIHHRKHQIIAEEKPFHETSMCIDSKPFMNVYFHEDQNSRQHFTSHPEFANFRAQRDLFYKILQIWESNHLNPNWKFSSEIAPKIKEIFAQSENCINMAHFAKLFVSQLLLSASNASSPEEIGLDMDLQKFSKLTQRLIAPSQFSVDYQFPRAQAFFRDFMVEARSMAFVEQLKLELYAELMFYNNSSFELINISRIEVDNEEQDISVLEDRDQFIVKPEILNSMLILAKFLGFATALPYTVNGGGGGNSMPTHLEKKQIMLRSLVQVNFDVSNTIKDAIKGNKLLICIPWLVQYFAMLDNVSLQLEGCMKALHYIFAIYWFLGSQQQRRPPNTNEFLICLCFGWLFETKQFLAEQYYSLINSYSMAAAKEQEPLELQFVKSHYILSCEDKENKIPLNETALDLNPLLESILPIACPFLAEFRVSIMPAKYAQTKYASRTGRYRHITTRITDMPATAAAEGLDKSAVSSSNNLDPDKPEQVEKTLIHAFLMSQNSSTKNLINICKERCYKSTVKDGQRKILLPSKSNADQLINQITSSKYGEVLKSVKAIYGNARTQAITEWKQTIPAILDNRIKQALDALLPEETPDVLKRTYQMIIKKDCTNKISQWFHTNMIKGDFYCENFVDLSNKICSANSKKTQTGSSELRIVMATPSVSDLLADLHYWLHCTSMREDLFTDAKPIVIFLRTMPLAFENVLPSVLYRLVAVGLIQLFQHILIRHSDHLSEDLIEAACNIWLHPNIQQFNKLNMTGQQEATSANCTQAPCIYESLITVSFMESLSRKSHCYDKLGNLLSIMIKRGLLTLSYIRELMEPILSYNWQPSILDKIINMLLSLAYLENSSKDNDCCNNLIVNL